VALDEFVTVDASETQKGSGAQLASYLGLDIINNVREARDSLHRMTDDFRIRNACLAKAHSIRLVILFFFRSTVPLGIKSKISNVSSSVHMHFNLMSGF
jgi:hypothetical protein